MAATLALGPGAVLSHTSAGLLWGMLRSRYPAGSVELPVHVTVRGHAETRQGIRVHRSRRLGDEEITRRVGIPVTTPSRTLKDLRRVLPESRFDQALRQTEFLGLPIDSALEPDHTRSELEARFLGLLRRHRLPSRV